MHRVKLLALSLLLAWAHLGGACGWGSLQTARPTPRGALDTTLGVGFVHNETVERRRELDEPGYAFSNFPLMINSRLGLTDRVDLGLKLFYMAGAQADTKVNLLSPSSPWALSVLSGLGAAKDLINKSKAALFHIPLVLHGSYDFACGVTPYLAVGYSMHWILGREREDTQEVQYADRKGHGDHLVTVTAGVQYQFNPRFSMQLEYNFWQPVLDDPGDFFSFVQNHMVMLGFTWRVNLFGPRRQPALPPPLTPHNRPKADENPFPAGERPPPLPPLPPAPPSPTKTDPEIPPG